MAGGVRLGGAYFELTGDSSGLVQELAKAEAASKKSVAAISAATGVAERDVQKLAQTYLQAETQRANASAQSALRIIKSHNDAADAIEKSAQKTSSSFDGAAKSLIGFTAAAAGVTLGAAAIHEAMSKIVTDTQAANQAAFALQSTFRGTTKEMQAFAEANAKQAGRSNTEGTAALAETRILATQYGYTDEQIRNVAKRTADLAAVSGVDLVKATHDTVAALRLEGDVAEELGLNLQQNAVQASFLTKAERERYNGLDPLTKSQITYQKFLEQSAFAEGEAAKRAGESAGAFDNLKASTTNLSVAVGHELQPQLEGTALWLSNAAKAAEDFFNRSAEVEKAIKELKDSGASGFTGGLIDVFTQGAKIREQVLKDREAAAAAASGTGSEVFGPDPSIVSALQRHQQVLDAAERDRLTDIHNRRVQEAKDGLDFDEQVHRREVNALDDRKQLLEGERAAKLRAVEAERDAALKGIEAESRAAKAASDAKIAGLRVEEEAAKRAAQAGHEDAVKGLEAEKQAVEDATAEQIRQLEIKRDHAKQASEDERDQAIKDLEAQTRARDDARVLEDRALDDAAQAIQRRLSDEHTVATRGFEDEAREIDKHKDKQLRAIDDEEKAAQKAHDNAARRLEEQSRSEDRRHRKRLQDIDDESKRQLDAIDAQIRALDDAQKQEDNAGKVADLQKKVADARTALTAATGTGTPEQITGARVDLTSAIKVGDPIAVKNATDRLTALAGQGADAVKKAQDDLNKTLGDLQAEQTKEVRDAQKEQLQIQKDAITAQADLAKRAEDVRDQQRKDRLQKDKQASDDTLKKAQDSAAKEKRVVDDQSRHDHEAIDARKRDEQDAHDDAVQAARDVAEQAKRAVADRRRVEDEATQDKRRQIADTYTEEQRQIKATYDDEDTGVIPALHRALNAEQERFRVRKQDADDAYAAEQRNIQDTYNDPVKGLIPLAEQAAAAVAQGFQDQAKATTEAAAQQTKAINDVYSNPVTHGGLLDLIEQARKDSEEKLQNQRDYWAAWAEDLGGENGQIAKVIGKWDELVKKITDVGGTVKVGANVTEPSFRGDASDGGGPGPGVGAGSDTVPDPYQVQFPFGARYSNPFNAGIPIHRGVDVTVKGAPNGGKGSPVSAFEDGEVTYSAYDPNGGNGIIIRGADGLYHRYFHFDSTSVSKGDRVRRGDQIGILGETGTEGSPHLHYEVSHNESGDPISDLIDPVPYMNRGGARDAAARNAGGRTFEFDLFGRHYTVTLPGGAGGMGLIRAIERFAESIGGREFGRAAASIALSEGADGDLTRPGSGGARGPFQFDPSGELPNYAAYLHKSIDAAGNYAGSHPLDAAAWALHGYLGDALRDGIDQGLRGADLAEYGSLVGQRPAGDLYKRAGDASRQLWGYRYGGWIPTPSYIVDAATKRPYAFAGEAGPERVLSPEQSQAFAGGSTGNTYRSGDVNFYGLTYEQAEIRQKQARHREEMLTGVR